MATHALSPAERRVLRRITPGGMPRIVTSTLAVAERKLDAEVTLGGSTAKGTHLADDHDIDIFIRYPPGTPHISDRAERGLKRAFRGVTRVHGSRDYFQVRRGAYTFEFVPVLKIKSWEEAENVTDMSPLHVTYVRRFTARQPRLADDIRLTKQFCKAQRVYGAETHIGGLSGYAVELLNIRYGGFRKLLSAIARWPERIALGSRSAVRSLNRSKTRSPLVLVDPVQPNRNAAAALTTESFDRLREAARKYLASPSEEFFRATPITAAGLRRKHPGAKVIVVQLTSAPGKEHIQGAKCRAVFEYLQRELLVREFPLLGAEWQFKGGRATLFFILRKGRLPGEEVVPGPPLAEGRHALQFRAKHAHTFEKEGRLYARKPRKFSDARTMIAHLLRQTYVSSRVQSARVGS